MIFPFHNIMLSFHESNNFLYLLEGYQLGTSKIFFSSLKYLFIWNQFFGIFVFIILLDAYFSWKSS